MSGRQSHPHEDSSNSGEPISVDDGISQVAGKRLRSFIERIERLESDKAEIVADMKEVFSEAKGEGFDTKIMRKVIRLRKMDKAKRQEEEAFIDLYLSAIGDDVL